MLTYEDVKFHDRLIEGLNAMSPDQIAGAYREARREFEQRRLAGLDAQEAEARRQILVHELPQA